MKFAIFTIFFKRNMQICLG